MFIYLLTTYIALDSFTACINDINAWMRMSRLSQPDQDASHVVVFWKIS